MSNQITKFDRNVIRQISQEAEDALKAVAKKHGLIVERQGGTFSAIDFRVPFKFSIVNVSDGVPETFIKDASWLGLTAEDFGREFLIPNGRGKEAYRITGINRSRRQYPISATRVRDGRNFKFSVHDVLSALNRPAQPERPLFASLQVVPPPVPGSESECQGG